MKTSQLVENIIDDLGIGTRSTAKLLEVSPTTIHRWLNEEVNISEVKLQSLKATYRAITNISKKFECEPKNIVGILLELKASPLWKGWDNAIELLGGSDQSFKNENYLKKHILQNPSFIGEGLKPIKRFPSKLNIDALFRDSRGREVAIKFYSKAVYLDEYGNIKILLRLLSKVLKRNTTLIIIAPRFAGTFIEISSENKNLKLLANNFSMTQVLPSGLL